MSKQLVYQDELNERFERYYTIDKLERRFKEYSTINFLESKIKSSLKDHYTTSDVDNRLHNVLSSLSSKNYTQKTIERNLKEYSNTINSDKRYLKLFDDQYVSGKKVFTGSVGIGTKPEEILHINKQGGRIALFKSEGYGYTEYNSSGSYLRLGVNPAGTYISSSSRTSLSLNSGGKSRLTIDAKGNIGIGTNKPATTLDVNCNTGMSTISITGSGGSELLFDNGTSIYKVRNTGSGISLMNNKKQIALFNTGSSRISGDLKVVGDFTADKIKATNLYDKENIDFLLSKFVSSEDFLRRITNCYNKIRRIRLKNTELVNRYPPLPLTSNKQLISPSQYGSGYYKVTNSDPSGNYWKRFDDYWRVFSDDSYFISPSLFDTNTGFYIGNGNTDEVSGLWIELSCPVGFVIDRYLLISSDTKGIPVDFYVYGSDDGIKWNLISKETKVNKEIKVTKNNNVYSYYRLVVRKINKGSSLRIDKFELYERVDHKVYGNLKSDSIETDKIVVNNSKGRYAVGSNGSINVTGGTLDFTKNSNIWSLSPSKNYLSITRNLYEVIKFSRIGNVKITGSLNVDGNIKGKSCYLNTLNTESITGTTRISTGTNLTFLSENGMIRFNKDGKLGVGTKNPTSTMTIHTKSINSNDIEPLIELQRSSINSNNCYRSSIRVKQGSTLSDPILFIGSSKGEAKHILLDYGNVGIGTSQPMSKLHVDGDVSCTKILADNIYEKGDIDERIDDEIEKYNNKRIVKEDFQNNPKLDFGGVGYLKYPGFVSNNYTVSFIINTRTGGTIYSSSSIYVSIIKDYLEYRFGTSNINKVNYNFIPGYWYWVVIYNNKGNVTVTIDGNNIDTKPIGVGKLIYPSQNKPQYIGCKPDLTDYFDGYISHIAVYKSSLLPEPIPTKTNKNLILYAPINEGIGKKIEGKLESTNIYTTFTDNPLWSYGNNRNFYTCKEAENRFIDSKQDVILDKSLTVVDGVHTGQIQISNSSIKSNSLLVSTDDAKLLLDDGIEISGNLKIITGTSEAIFNEYGLDLGSDKKISGINTITTGRQNLVINTPLLETDSIKADIIESVSVTANNIYNKNEIDSLVVNLSSKQTITGEKYFSSGLETIKADISNRNIKGGIFIGDGSEHEEALVLTSYTNHPITFNTHNIERIRITDTGYLGVNTTNPETPLHVYGTTKVEGDIKLDGSISGISSLVCLETTITGFRFSVNEKSILEINETGNIGIGTNNPQTDMHLINTTPVLRLETSTVGSRNSGEIQFREIGGTGIDIRYSGEEKGMEFRSGKDKIISIKKDELILKHGWSIIPYADRLAIGYYDSEGTFVEASSVSKHSISS